MDYTAIAQEYINSCTSCKVLLVHDLLQKSDLYGMIREGCKPPDHSIVELTLQTLSYNDTDQVGETIQREPAGYNLKNGINFITFQKTFLARTVGILYAITC